MVATIWLATDLHVRSLTLVSFGAYRDHQVTFAPGLNVIYGPNESGKSTLHAAVYAALCGQRRGRGQAGEERAFERHRPWEAQGWEVSTILELVGGRRIELRQDLERKVSSQAVDLDVGRDVTAEILFEGAPDASRWLGLDRRAFLATACVRQADVLAVTSEPTLLSEHLQRAAATAGTDGTAIAALTRIEEYRRLHVGRDRAGSTKPLRQARDAMLRARARLQEAKEAHLHYIELAARVKELDQREEALRSKCQGLEAELGTGNSLIGPVQSALRAWRTRRPVPAPPGPSSKDLRTYLSRLRDSETMDPALALRLREKQSTGRLLPVLVAGAVVLAGMFLALVTQQAVIGIWSLCLAAAAGGTTYAVRSGRLARERTQVREMELANDRRLAVEQQLLTRIALEEAAADAESAMSEVESELREVAARCRLDGYNSAALATEMEAWLSRCLSQRQQAERDHQELAELQRLAAEARGSLQEAERQLPSVPDAEEELAASEAELTHVLHLARILDLTQGFLEQAQERVHRDISPVLTETLRTWLPEITTGRYHDAMVNSETLEVQVCGAQRHWRRAELLSQGTQEQVYLLLRLALVEHLSRRGEPCPLLLDEVTVHSDARRTESLLSLIHRISTTHQVLLFTQEDQVADWARNSLRSPQDQLLELDRPPTTT
jgi:uncharacterized protein YhaN